MAAALVIVAIGAAHAQPIEWDQRKADQTKQLDRAMFNTRICLDGSIRIALRGGLRDRKSVSAFTMPICGVPFLTVAKQLGVPERFASDAFDKAVGEELDAVLAVGH